MNANAPPQRRVTGLLVDDLDDETLVYDLSRHKAHCLNLMARRVWKLCDGRMTTPEIASALERELNTPIDKELVRMALEQLDKARLLAERLDALQGTKHPSRRQLITKLGLAASLVPVITSLPAPAAAAGASVCAGVNVGGNCNNKNCPAGQKCTNVAGFCVCA